MQYHMRDGAVLLPCVNGPRKAARTMDFEDRITCLPEHVVTDILCRLTMKEAMCTSVVSRKWRFFWTHFNGCLDFDASLLIFKYNYKVALKPIEVERLNFVDWVNRTLNCIQSPTIEGLRVSFDVMKSKKDIDNWVSFAVSKRAKCLELDLTEVNQSTILVGRYLFPSHLLCEAKYGNCLLSLRLKNVDVTEEILSSILFHCPFLEVLCVSGARTLKRFLLPDSSNNLKCVELIGCHVEDIEISGVNLVSFSFYGEDIDIHYKNVPRLVKLSVGGLYARLPLYNFGQISAFCSQLETLILEVPFRRICDEFPEHIPEFTNLKHFELGSFICSTEYSLLPFTSLLKASPSLQKFTLMVMGSFAEPELDYEDFATHLSEHEHPYPCLKVMELKGFAGSPAEMEILFHLFDNASALETLIVDACTYEHLGKPQETLYRRSQSYRSARLLAMELRTKIPPRIGLTVI